MIDPGTIKKSDKRTKIYVKAGQTVVLEVKVPKEIHSDITDRCDKKIRISLMDSERNLIQTSCRVLFIDKDHKEFFADITNGKGCAELVDGDYQIIIDNDYKKSESYPKHTDEAKSISISNMKYIRSGFLYKVKEIANTSTSLYANTQNYNKNWRKGDDEFDSNYFKGVFDSNTYLPPRAKRTMRLGSLTHNSYIRIDQVLFYAKEVSNKNRKAPFFAGKISTDSIQLKNRFSWLVYDDDGNSTQKAEPALTQVNIKGPASIKLEVKVTDILYGKNNGIAVLGSEITNDPRVTEIDWVVPVQQSNDHRLLYYKNTDGKPERLIGVTNNKGFAEKRKVSVTIVFKLQKELESGQIVPIKLSLVKKDISERNKTGFPITGPTVLIASSNKAAPLTYHVRISSPGLLWDILELSKMEDNYFQILQLAVEYKNVDGNPYYILSKEYLYPVLQKFLFYYPGVFGSKLEVLKEGSDTEYVEAWPRFRNDNLLLTECNKWGEVFQKAKPDLEVLENAGPLDLISICEAHERVAEILASKEFFPPVYLNEKLSKDEKLKLVVYKEIAYDWRLPLNPYLRKNEENELQDYEKKYPFLAYIGRKLKSIQSKLKEDTYFADNALSLVGHSTGGLIIKALVSFDSELQKQVSNLFYISVPFYGAPKTEIAFIEGDLDDEFFGIDNYVTEKWRLREIAANMPIMYILSAKEPYFKNRFNEERFDIQSRQDRFLKAAENGLYIMYPRSLPHRASQERETLRFNSYLAKLADEFEIETTQSYPSHLSAYIFYSKGHETIAKLEFPGEGKYLTEYNVVSLSKEEISSQKIIETLDNESLPEGLKNVDLYYFDEDTEDINYFKSKHQFSGNTRIAVIREGKSWQISDSIPEDFSDRDLELTAIFYFQDNLIKYRQVVHQTLKEYNKDLIVKKTEKYGDGTVPEKSLKGLALDHRNSKVRLFAKINYSDVGPQHDKSMNHLWVWERVIRVLKNDKTVEKDFESI